MDGRSNAMTLLLMPKMCIGLVYASANFPNPIAPNPDALIAPNCNIANELDALGRHSIMCPEFSSL